MHTSGLQRQPSVLSNCSTLVDAGILLPNSDQSRHMQSSGPGSSSSTQPPQHRQQHHTSATSPLLDDWSDPSPQQQAPANTGLLATEYGQKTRRRLAKTWKKVMTRLTGAKSGQGGGGDIQPEEEEQLDSPVAPPATRTSPPPPSYLEFRSGQADEVVRVTSPYPGDRSHITGFTRHGRSGSMGSSNRSSWNSDVSDRTDTTTLFRMLWGPSSSVFIM